MYNSGQSSHQKIKSKKGQPGRDYPILVSIPKTSFECSIDGHRNGGFYADPETGCQVWHMCQGLRKHSFLCPNGTIFNQKAGICDWWYNVDCVNPIQTFPKSGATGLAASLDLSVDESASSAGREVLIDFERRKKVYTKYFKS